MTQLHSSNEPGALFLIEGAAEENAQNKMLHSCSWADCGYKLSEDKLAAQKNGSVR